MPWYTTPAALRIIRKLKAHPPRREFVRDKVSLNYHDGHHEYRSMDALELAALFAIEFNKVQLAPVWDREAAVALMQTSDDEILAALFGDPDSRDWAHPDRAARRTALAMEIDEALDVRLAA